MLNLNVQGSLEMKKEDRCSVPVSRRHAFGVISLFSGCGGMDLGSWVVLISWGNTTGNGLPYRMGQ